MYSNSSSNSPSALFISIPPIEVELSIVEDSSGTLLRTS